jgi:hypothetical protein
MTSKRGDRLPLVTAMLGLPLVLMKCRTEERDQARNDNPESHAF